MIAPVRTYGQERNTGLPPSEVGTIEADEPDTPGQP